jgi:uroporphyrin-III C-methyltransferase
MNGKVYIVGVGPGDPELITIKAKRIIEIADVLLYDRLISSKILEYARIDAEKIYVGKQLGDANLQDYINRLLLQKAREGKIIARLKGGDPYVFGRGEEECMFLIENGIECEVIPGITSAIAVPAYAGIPVTSRLASHGFTVITGTIKEDNVISEDYIPKKGTLIVFMAIHNIKKVKDVLLKVRDAEEDIAIIENGTLPEQRVILGKLKNLDNIVENEKINPPALIIIGSVVRFRDKLWRYK